MHLLSGKICPRKTQQNAVSVHFWAQNETPPTTIQAYTEAIKKTESLTFPDLKDFLSELNNIC